MSRAQNLKSPLHTAALQWAAAGFHVFPCHVGRKEPATVNGLNDATTDVAHIDAWWTENPDYNVGCAPHMSGNSVLDADPPLGMNTLAELEKAHGALPKTLVITTPRGGLHLWFDGIIPSTAQKLGPKLDTRGQGGYVLVPPSIIAAGEYKNNPTGGSYAVKDESDIAEIPAWIGARIVEARDRISAGTEDLDTPDAVRRVRATLERLVAAGDVAIEGSGGDDRTFRLCCEVLDLGVSNETAFDLIANIWNPRCNPPWTDEELRTKIENAGSYRQNEVGAYAIAPAAETFAHIAEKFGGAGTSEPSRPRSKFYPLDLSEQSTQEEPEWIIPSLIPAKGAILVYGQKKSFKSFLVLDLALGIATGEETFGFQPKVGAVVYAVGEGQSNISRKHAPAWRIAKGRQDDFPFYVVPRVPRVIMEEETKELVDAIRSRGIRPAVVVIDTMARAIGGLEENSAKDVGVFVAACDYIREQLGCAVIVVHHSGKDGARGSRGSNALEGAFDTVLEVKRHEKSMHVALFVRDQRSAQEREEPYLFEGHLVGPSLVFQPSEKGAYRAAVEEGELITAKKIGAVLQTLNAYGYENGITTEVLAAELARGNEVDEKVLVKSILKERRRQEAIAMLSDGAPLLWHLMSAPA